MPGHRSTTLAPPAVRMVKYMHGCLTTVSFPSWPPLRLRHLVFAGRNAGDCYRMLRLLQPKLPCSPGYQPIWNVRPNPDHPQRNVAGSVIVSDCPSPSTGNSPETGGSSSPSIPFLISGSNPSSISRKGPAVENAETASVIAISAATLIFILALIMNLF